MTDKHMERCDLVPFLRAKKANIPTLGPRFLVKFPRVGKAVEVKCPTYARGVGRTKESLVLDTLPVGEDKGDINVTNTIPCGVANGAFNVTSSIPCGVGKGVMTMENTKSSVEDKGVISVPNTIP